ncbi:TonB-dependent receptor [Sphingobium estronivorans]|uniref:TonB-dependent receptor n=1 Tax=Sphingobium estronivorans TaxID=1577690 RepID=UPI0019679CA2|nr:TonB-dependent receptor [Sphingobium estronivorans]
MNGRDFGRRNRMMGMAGCSLLALLGAVPAIAQDSAPASVAADAQALPSAGDAVGEIVVTGSRLRRKDADSVGPISTITAEDIARSGASSAGELLQKLPAAGVSLNSNGTQGTSYGASSINLRYLGGAEGSGNRVLVLVDGHRWVDAVGQRGFRDFVDLNTMPMGMIDGIEVLKDGASAIYGADAIAGVVNIKTVQPFDGIRGSIKAGVTDKGDGAEYSAIVNVGKKWDRGSIILSASYFKSEPILTTARSRTATSLVPVTTPGTSPNGLFVLPGLSNNNYFGTAAGFASSANPIVYNNAGMGGGSLADNSFHTASLPGDYYNTLAQGIYSAGPSERYGFYGRFDHELSDTINLKIEGLWNKRTSDQLFAPVNLDIGGTAGTVRGFAIGAGQAYNPFGTANGVPVANAVGFASTSAWRIRKILTAVGNRDNYQNVQTWRVAAGLDGSFDMLGHEWKWDVYGAYSKNVIHSAAYNQVNYDALYLGLSGACATTAGCVPIDLFGTMTQAQANYIRYNAYESNQTELYNANANLTGTLVDLPAGPLQLAIGYEYRQNRAEDHPDVFANTASAYLGSAYTSTSVQTRTASKGSYDLHEVYGELSIPIFKNQPFAESLDVDLATRYSRYNTVGGKATVKAGVGYRPIHDILLRGTYSQGFRAPSILELYQGARQTNFQGTDPCNGGAAANPNLPGCAGVPAGYNQSGVNNGLLMGTISGNRDLKAETADTFSGGVALTPSFLRGFTLTVDYFSIKVKNAIALQSATQILQLCATQGGVFCDLVTRDAGTGAITDLVQAVQNLNAIKTDGVDISARYDFRTGIGAFSAAVDASWLHSFRTTSPNPAGGADIVDERAGKGDQPRATYPRWKGQASLSWALDDIDATVRARYIGPSTDIVNTVKDARTKSIIYTDAEFGVGIDDNRFRLTLGVNNLFDVQPPASYANAPINYDIYTYDARGRYLYVRAAVKM